MKKVILLSLMLLALLINAETIRINENDYKIELLNENNSETIINCRFGNFNVNHVDLDGKVYSKISWNNNPPIHAKGAPDLPKAVRSLIIDNKSSYKIELVKSEYTDYNLDILPSKGIVGRENDISEVPYTFSDCYSKDSFFPGSLYELGNPYIMREFRGHTVTFYPFQYNPVSGTLRVYHNMTVKVSKEGFSSINVKETVSTEISPYFEQIYKNHFINYNSVLYPAMEETGKLLVIAPAGYFEEIQPYVDWKNTKGIETELVSMAAIGSSPEDVRQYIQNEYDSSLGENPLTFVQLVGDVDSVPTFIHQYSNGSSLRTGAADPMYSLLSGNDSYPEIFVGRFTCDTEDELITQVRKTIEYERDLSSGDWLHKATGIASNLGGANGDDLETDDDHIENIRTDLLAYNYTEVDSIYAPYGSTEQAVNAINEGRGFINYTGHGSVTSWVNGARLVNQNIEMLENDNKLPFVFAVACLNGNFPYNQCFAEVWLKAKNDQTGEPTGGVAFYGASVQQAWAPPMAAQDESADLLVADQVETIGGLFFSGSCQMIDEYTSLDIGANLFKTWIIFGDASLQLRTNTPAAMNVIHSGTMYSINENMAVQTGTPGALVSLTYNNSVISSGFADSNGMITLIWNPEVLPAAPADLKLTVSAFNKTTYSSNIQLIPPDGPCLALNRFFAENSADYNSLTQLSLEIENFGNQTGNNISFTIRSDNPQVTITDSTASLSQLISGGIMQMNDAFEVQFGNEISDQESIQFSIHASSDETDWNFRTSINVNAPKFTVSSFNIIDSDDSNNLPDAGETLTLEIGISNSGHAVSEAGALNLFSPSDALIFLERSSEIPALNTGQENIVQYSVRIADTTSSGTVIPLGISAESGYYISYESRFIDIGAVFEGFENNSAQFNWEYAGNADWGFATEYVYEGTKCFESGSLGLGQTSVAKFNAVLPVTGTLSFYKKVSSAQGFSFLEFYIDGALAERWSGETDWGLAEYNVTSGYHEFKWIYRSSAYALQDQSDNKGWIDNISLPTNGSSYTALMSLESGILDFSRETNIEPAQKIYSIVNYGNVILAGTMSINSEDFYILYNESSRRVVDFSVQPGQSKDFILVYDSRNSGLHNAVMTIESNDPYSPADITLRGSTTTANNEDNLNFETGISNIYPNPFNPETNIQFALKNDAEVEISIYNIKGQKVKSLKKEQYTKGQHTVTWKGKDNNNSNVSSGVYFIRLSTGKTRDIRKAVLLK